MSNTKAKVEDKTDLTADEWFAEVVRICKERDYADWFYADREAWLECKDEMMPLQAVDYQLECLF